jgi:hypothetical protein
MTQSEEKLIERVEQRLAGEPFVVRKGMWVKDLKNRVGLVLSTGKQKGKRWAHVQYGTITQKGVMKKRTCAIWCRDLRPT